MLYRVNMFARFMAGLKKGLAVLLVASFSLSPAHATGMPQLDFSNPLVTGQVIWGAGIFLIFYLILAYGALPRIAKTMRERNNQITSDADEARRAKQDADRAFEEQEAELSAARKTAKDHVKKLLEEENQKSEQMKLDAAEGIKKEIAAAEARIAKQKEAALGDMRQIAVNLTGQIVMRFVGSPAPEALITQKVEALVAKQAAKENL